METPPASPAEDAAPPAQIAHCRRCGYSLRGLAGGQCPECGGAFDLSDRRTFARKPPRPALWRWVRHVVVVAALLGLAIGSVPGWYWWQWRAEQRSLDTIRALGGTVAVRRVEAQGPGRWLPERWAFLRDRALEVELHHLTAEQAGRLDLRTLGRLESLSLEDSHVGDPALAQLRGLTELRHLILDRNPLDGSGRAHLADCRRLEHLSLLGTRLTDAGLEHVGRQTSLRRLWLGHTAVTDAGLAHLAGLSSLDTLHLRGTAVTPAGLRRLRGLTSLGSLYLSGTELSEQGCRDLRRALPSVRIYD